MRPPMSKASPYESKEYYAKLNRNIFRNNNDIRVNLEKNLKLYHELVNKGLDFKLIERIAKTIYLSPVPHDADPSIRGTYCYLKDTGIRETGYCAWTTTLYKDYPGIKFRAEQLHRFLCFLVRHEEFMAAMKEGKTHCSHLCHLNNCLNPEHIMFDIPNSHKRRDSDQRNPTAAAKNINKISYKLWPGDKKLIVELFIGDKYLVEIEDIANFLGVSKNYIISIVNFYLKTNSVYYNGDYEIKFKDSELEECVRVRLRTLKREAQYLLKQITFKDLSRLFKVAYDFERPASWYELMLRNVG